MRLARAQDSELAAQASTFRMMRFLSTRPSLLLGALIGSRAAYRSYEGF